MRKLTQLIVPALLCLSLISVPVMRASAQDDPVADAIAASKTDAATEASAEAKTSILKTASEAADSDTAPPVGGVPWLLSGLALVVTILTKLLPLIPPNYRTYASIAVAVLAQLYASLGELSATGHAVTAGAVLWAMVDAFLNRMKTTKTIDALKARLLQAGIDPLSVPAH